jgi:Holliday junction DNA helicase RuvA
MISFVKGRIVEIALDHILIENNAIGYKVYTSRNSIDDFFDIENNDEAMVYTEMIVREDDISLYGFSTTKELEIFNLLRTVNRVGAKSSLKILSTLNYLDIARIISNEDHKALTEAKGIGKKTAKRMILDLKDKMNELVEYDHRQGKTPQKSNTFAINEEALEALMSLGYTKTESKQILTKFDSTDLTLEETIKEALKLL